MPTFEHLEERRLLSSTPYISAPPDLTVSPNGAVTLASELKNQISVSDSSGDNSVLEVRLSVDYGTLTLANTAGLQIVKGDAKGSNYLDFFGSIKDVNIALDGLRYSPIAGYIGLDDLHISTIERDRDHQSAHSDVLIRVASPYNMPFISTPDAQHVNQEDTLTFSSWQLNPILLGDSSGEDTQLEVTLQVDNGTLSLASDSGLKIIKGDPNGSSYLALLGSIGDINHALEGLTYSPNSDYYGSQQLRITSTVIDQDAQVAKSEVAINITPLYTTPFISTPGLQSMVQDAEMTFGSSQKSQITLGDSSGLDHQLQVSLSVRNGTLSLADTTGLKLVRGDAKDSAQLAFWGAINNINEAIDGLRYTPTAGFTGMDVLRIISTELEGDGRRAKSSVAIEVSSPISTIVIVSPNVLTVTEGETLTFNREQKNGILINDPTGANPQVELTLIVENGVLSLSQTDGCKLIEGDASGASILIIAGKIKDINQALESLVYSPNKSYSGGDALRLSLVEQEGESHVSKSEVTIKVYALGPSLNIVAPVVQTVLTNESVSFASWQNTQISIDDRDATDGPFEIILSVHNGSFSLERVDGLTILKGDAADANYLMILGTIKDINNALEGLKYSPNSEFSGGDELRIAVNEQDGERRESAIVLGIQVVAQGAAIEIATPDAQKISQTHSLSFSSEQNNQIAIIDRAGVDGQFEVGLYVDQGVLCLDRFDGLKILKGNPAGSNYLLVLGTLKDLNNSLENLRYFPNSRFAGVDELRISVAELSGLNRDAKGAVVIHVTAAETTLSLVAPGMQDVVQSSEWTFASSQNNQIAIFPADGSNGLFEMILSVRSGTLALADLNGLLMLTGNVEGSSYYHFLGTAKDINNALEGLRYTPTAGFVGDDTLQLSASDIEGDGQSVYYDIELHVLRQNQAPHGADLTISTLQNAAHVFSIDDFGFADLNEIQPNELLAIQIVTLPVRGLLAARGASVTTGQFISVTDIRAGLFRFLPGAAEHGAGFASFAFLVQDDGGTENGGADLGYSPNTITLDVIATIVPPPDPTPTETASEPSDPTDATPPDDSTVVTDPSASSPVDHVPIDPAPVDPAPVDTTLTPVPSAPIENVPLETPPASYVEPLVEPPTDPRVEPTVAPSTSQSPLLATVAPPVSNTVAIADAASSVLSQSVVVTAAAQTQVALGLWSRTALAASQLAPNHSTMKYGFLFRSMLAGSWQPGYAASISSGATSRGSELLLEQQFAAGRRSQPVRPSNRQELHSSINAGAFASVMADVSSLAFHGRRGWVNVAFSSRR